MLEKDVRDFFYKTKENYNLVAGQKELYIDGLRIDIFAIDRKGNPFIIEFKKDKNRHVVGQSAHYLALIPSKHKEIEKKLNFLNINWTNLKVLCIAKSFNQRDFDALNFEPIKDRVFLYQYDIIKDYREKAIFSLDLTYKGANGTSPLYIPPKPVNELDFAEHFKKLITIEGKESKRQYYTDTVLPLLNVVSLELGKKYADKGLYPHISYFQSGPHVLFRLGLDKDKPHRAAIAISFYENFIESGFDLTHSLKDAEKLRLAFKEKADEIASKLLSLKDYSIYMPNVGIEGHIPFEIMDLKGIKLFLDNYNPTINKECYIDISRQYDNSSITKDELITLFDREYNNFGFLLDEIKDSL